jgi:TolB protein
MAAVMLKALSKQPGHRFSSVTAFLSAATEAAGMDLEQILPFLNMPMMPAQPSHRPASTPKNPAKPDNQQTTSLGLYLAMGAIALGIIVVLFNLNSNRGERPAAQAAQPGKAVTESIPIVGRSEPGSPKASQTEDAPTNESSIDTGKPTGKIVYTCQVDRQEDHDQICLINTDGSGRKQLTQDISHQNYYPSLSPDGKTIIFSSNRNGGMEIFEMDVDGENIRQLTSGLGECFAPEISPDGSRVVFLRNRNGKNYVSLMKRDGTFVGDLSDHLECKDPTWSPDGSQILFASSQSGSPQFYVINSDGSQVRQITNMAGFRGRSDWASDGTMASYAGDSKKHNREIVFFNEKIAPYSITSGGDNLAPSFSPNGQWVTFMSYRDNFWDSDGCEIYIMRLSDSHTERLTNNNYCDYQPRWGP